MLQDTLVEMADVKVIKENGTLTTYALGSCVGVCIYDPVTGVGGMLHAMLPDSQKAEMVTNYGKYVDTGIEELYKKVCRMGGDKRRLKAKVVGGAKMFEYKTTPDEYDIGTANVLQTQKYLQKLGIPIVCQVTGGQVGRTIRFHPAKGSVMIRSTDGKVEVI